MEGRARETTLHVHVRGHVIVSIAVLMFVAFSFFMFVPICMAGHAVCAAYFTRCVCV